MSKTIATYLSLAAYKAGAFLYDEKNVGMVSAEKEVEHIIRDLKRLKLKSKDMAVAARTGTLLMDILELSTIQAGADGESKDGRLANIKLDKHVGALVGSVNEYLTSIGVVGALLLTIAFPGITQPLQPSQILVNSTPFGPNAVDRKQSPQGPRPLRRLQRSLAHRVIPVLRPAQHGQHGEPRTALVPAKPMSV